MPKRTFVGPNSLISVKELDVRGTVWCSATLGCDNTAVGELEALNRIAPYVRRIALIFNPQVSSHALYLPSIEAAAVSFIVAVHTNPVLDPAEIEPAMGAH